MTKRIVVISLMAVLACMLGSSAAFAQTGSTRQHEGKRIMRLQVENNKSVGEAKILSKIKTKQGVKYSHRVISQDLKRLYETGFFTDITIDVQDHEGGVKVIFIVTEKPIVEKVVFSGNKRLRDDKLAKEVITKPDEMLSHRQLKQDRDAIRKLYEKNGFHLAKVDQKIDVNDKTNKAVVNFVITEAEKVRIKRIFVEGNVAFKDKKILRLISTRKDTLFTSGFFKKEIFERDLNKLETFYRSQGYIDVKVDSDLRYDAMGKALYLTLTIDEGKKYYVGQIKVKGNKRFATVDIMSNLTMLSENTYTQEGLKSDTIHIQEFYFHKGYISAEVKADTLVNEKTGKVDVVYKIKEGKLAYVDRIDIKGNVKTKDIVIRRELRIYPGEKFDGDKLRRSKERLYNLGYFEEVSYDIEPGSAPDKKNLAVTVKETKTGEFSFGAGYSSVDKAVGFVDITQKNFDALAWPTFTGDGQQLRLRAEFGTIRRNYELGFTEPWIFDYPLLFGFDLYRRARSRETDIGYGYDEERQGGDIRLGKELGEYNRADFTYRLEDVDISDVSSGASEDLTAEEGQNTISSAEIKLTHDTRDNIFNPATGLNAVGTVEYAGGALSGDKNFLKYSLGTSVYFSHWEKNVLELKFRAGAVDDFDESDRVPIYERFFAGGANTIRGYRERRVGPRDPSSKDPIGGKSMMIANVEYTFPIVKVLKGAVFCDVGNVWPTVSQFGSGDLKSGAGLGVRVKTPIGPVRLDYGYPLDADPDEEEKGRFHFTMSRGF